MNKVVIIGNGFDLGHGLKTKYSDFIIWYFRNILKELEQGKKVSDKLIEIAPEGRIKGFRIEYEDDIANLLQTLARMTNMKFSYKSRFFRDVLFSLRDRTWVDIEMIFYQHLVNLQKRYDSFPNDKKKVIEEVCALNQQLHFIHKLLKEYLSTICQNDDSLLNTELLNKLQNELQLDNEINNNVLFINFNYTETINLYLQHLNHRAPECIWIHGKLNSIANPTIFGYGDQMDSYFRLMELTRENAFLENMKTFQYNITNNYKMILGFLADGKYRVSIMGHSCGLSDRTILNKIFENQNCNSIKLFFHQREEGTNDFREKMFEIYRHFSESQKDLMLEKVVSLENSEALIRLVPQNT